MKKCIIVVVMLLSGSTFAQSALLSRPNEGFGLSPELVMNQPSTFSRSTNASSKGYSSYTRGSGFYVRPELYRGLFVTLGYQFNPYVQSIVSVGYGDGITGSIGARAYTNDGNWAAMFDLRLSTINFSIHGISLVAGAAYKDLDFGVGGSFYTDGYYYLIVPVITVGWNIRCYQHR